MSVPDLTFRDALQRRMNRLTAPERLLILSEATVHTHDARDLIACRTKVWEISHTFRFTLPSLACAASAVAYTHLVCREDAQGSLTQAS